VFVWPARSARERGVARWPRLLGIGAGGVAASAQSCACVRAQSARARCSWCRASVWCRRRDSRRQGDVPLGSRGRRWAVSRRPRRLAVSAGGVAASVQSYSCVRTQSQRARSSVGGGTRDGRGMYRRERRGGRWAVTHLPRRLAVGAGGVAASAQC
jgi:hypothetical protein